MSSSNVKNKYLLLIAFISGMVIMSIEMSASRLLAPYFGTSIFVWTNVIGLVMIALSLGYYIGGKLADKKPSKSLLLKIIVIASIFIIIIPFIVRPVVSLSSIDIFKARPSSFVILAGSFFATLFLFAIPIFLLGMVSPFIIRLLTKDRKNVGNIAGSIFAFSTIGSILGTFLSTILLIPAIGTKKTIIISALVLLFFSLIGLIRNNKKYLLLFLFFPLAFINFYNIKNTPGTLHEGESAYQYIQIVEKKDKTRQMLFNEGLGINSIYNPEKILTGFYYDYYNILPYLRDEIHKNVLVIGLAGGTIPRQYNYFFNDEDIEIDGVEIDNEVIEAAKNYFDVSFSNLNIYNEEGRMFLKRSKANYDIIIIDAYNNQLHIPFHLTTDEFFEEVKNKLNSDGIIAININAFSNSSELLIAITNTISSVFENVYVMPIKGSYNFMVIGSGDEIDFNIVNSKTYNEDLKIIFNNIIEGAKKYTYDPFKTTLTDDRAPIEYLTDKMVFEYFK